MADHQFDHDGLAREGYDLSLQRCSAVGAILLRGSMKSRLLRITSELIVFCGVPNYR
jgi:hypothetical protein